MGLGKVFCLVLDMGLGMGRSLVFGLVLDMGLVLGLVLG